MNYCAIIAEFNPLTNGHKHIINKAKDQTGLDIVCLMSGNFVQRGEPAILNKEERATAAILNGASIVLELPLTYAISSAEIFASGAIKILSGIKSITHLAFGVETNTPQILEEIAKIKATKNTEIKELVKKEIKNGINHNKATVLVLKRLYKEKASEIEEVFNGSNNILAIEYLTAIYKEKANITPVYIKRLDNGYNSNKISKIKINNSKVCFASASMIRKLIYGEKYRKIKNLVPKETFNSLTKLNKNLINERNTKLDCLVLNQLRKHDVSSLSNFYDYSQSLSGLIAKLSTEQTNTNDITNLASGKSFRPARIRKLLLYPLFNLTKENFHAIFNGEQSVLLLAADERKKQDISKFKNQSSTNIIVSVKDYNNINNKKTLELDQLSSDIYSLITNNRPNKNKAIFI